MAQPNKCRVYVGNLSWKVRWQDLKDHMKQVGDVVRADIIEDYGGKSKGCGLVEFASEESAARAIAELNDTMILDRPIFVREDRESYAGAVGGLRNGRRFIQTAEGSTQDQKLEASPSGGGTSNYGATRNYRTSAPSDKDYAGSRATVIVTNLQWKTSWQNLKDLFKTCGTVSRVDILTHDDGRPKGIAKVVFANEFGAKKAVSTFHDYILGGRKIGVRFDT